MSKAGRQYALLAAVSLLAVAAFGQRSDHAVARRQDGVFFGLGGIDAHSMPFDLDAFFEHAAPTRTTRSGVPGAPSTARPNRKTTFTTPRSVPTATPRSSAASSGGHFDSFPERREFPVTSSRFLLPSVDPQAPQRSARPTFKQAAQNVQRASAFAPATSFVSEGQGFRGQTHNVDSLQQRFAPQSPPSRQKFIDRPSLDAEFDQQASQPIRRPLPSSFRNVRPESVPTREEIVQDTLPQEPNLQANRLPARHPPFRPSLPVSGQTPQQFPATAHSARPAAFANEQPFDNRPRFPIRRPATDTESPRFQEQSPPSPPAQGQRQQQQQQQHSSPDSFQDFDDTRLFPSDDEQQSFRPEEDQFNSRPIDSSEDPTQPFFDSQEDHSSRPAPQPTQEANQPEPNSQFDFGADVSTDNGQHPQDDNIFDGPSQDPPPQDVDEQDSGAFGREPDFFIPDSRETDGRQPHPPSPPFQSQEEVFRDDRKFAPEGRPGNGPSGGPSGLEQPPNDFAGPPSPQRHTFEAPQPPVAFRPAPVHRPTVAPRPSLSHRGISGVVPSPQLHKPDPQSHIPRTQAVLEGDGNRHQNEARFVPPPQRPAPSRGPAHGVAGNDFAFQPPTRPTRPSVPTTTEPAFSEVRPPVVSDQHHFRQMQTSFRPPTTTEANVDISQSFPNGHSDDRQEEVFTRIPSHHSKPGHLGSIRATSRVTPQFFQSNDELTGQLSPTFVRATEPTNFEVETSERPTNPRFSLTSGHASGPSTQFETARDRSRSRAPQAQQRVSTSRRRPLPRPDASSSSAQNLDQSEFAFDSPQSTIDVATSFQLPQSKFSTEFSRRPSVSRAESDVKQKSHKRLPVTQSAGRLITANRGSKRGPVLPGRTAAAQFATENTIDDVSLQNSLPTRTRGGSHSSSSRQGFGLDSRAPAAPAVAGQVATACNPSVCQLPRCFCGGNQISPGNLRPDEIPQIVVLTFDDAVNDLNWALYTRLFFKDRKNPNGCPILSTFYVSHEWTDYAKVQNLYAAGHEIASHSISHGDGRDYSKKKWYNEIYGQREILSVYANVKLDDVKGMRTPFLAMGGDKQFSMLYETNFTYESSMTVTDVHPPYWPYTLDYAVPHRCAIPPCPKLSYPGFWEIPMVALTDLNGGKCSMADSCSFATTEDGIYEMLMKNFERHYTSNRSPFGLYYHASWFLVPHRQEGFVKFLEEILQKDDVYLVTALQMLEWVKNPTPLSDIQRFEPWRCDRNDRVPPCNRPKSCELRFKGDVRYMSTCNSCPNVYPWVGDTGVTKHVHTISS